VHEQGGAHGALHPGWVGVDVEGRLTVRPALTAAVRSDPDGDATAQATDCIQLASILEALELERLDESALSLLMRGVARDRARLRVQPGRAVRQSLTYILNRHKEWEASLVETLGEDWQTTLIPRALTPLPDVTPKHPWTDHGTRIPRVGTSAGSSTATVDILAAGRPLSGGESPSSVAVQVTRAEVPRSTRSGESSTTTGVRVKVRKASASVRPAPSMPARVPLQPAAATVAVVPMLRAADPAPASSSAARSVPNPVSPAAPASISIRPSPEAEAAVPADAELAADESAPAEDAGSAAQLEQASPPEGSDVPAEVESAPDPVVAPAAQISEEPQDTAASEAPGEADAPSADAEVAEEAEASEEADASEEAEQADDAEASEASEEADDSEDATQVDLEVPPEVEALVAVVAPEGAGDGLTAPSIEALPHVAIAERDDDAATAVPGTASEVPAVAAPDAVAAVMVEPTFEDDDFEAEGEALERSADAVDGLDAPAMEIEDSPLESATPDPLVADDEPSVDEETVSPGPSTEGGFVSAAPALASLLADIAPDDPIPGIALADGATEDPESVDEVFEDDEKTAVTSVPEPVRQALARLDAGRSIREEPAPPTPTPPSFIPVPAPAVLQPPTPSPAPKPRDLAAPTSEDAPLWAGLKGVTGDASRDEELGSGKWEEEARPLSELRREMSQEPVREMEDIDPSKGSLASLAIAIGAFLVLCLMWYFWSP
jgi:hypothetical protein